MLKKVGFTYVATLAALQQTYAAIGVTAVDNRLAGRNDDAVSAGTSILSYIVSLLSLVAVGFLIYGGFLIVTAGGADDQMKKGKTIIIQAIAGILLIFLANSIVGWVITKLSIA